MLWCVILGIDVKKLTRRIKNVKKRLIINVFDKYTKLFKPNEKVLQKNYLLSFLVCMSTFESYGSSLENFLYLPCYINHLKVVLCKNLAGLVELNILATRK